MGEAHHGHHHGPAAARAGARHARPLLIAFALIVSFLVVQVIVGLATSSLALLSDAGHMATDALGLGMALAAIHAASAARAHPQRTFGLYRLEILAALANAVLLFAVAGYVLSKRSTASATRRDVDLGAGARGRRARPGGEPGGVRPAARGAPRRASTCRAPTSRCCPTRSGSVGVIVAAIVWGVTGWNWVDPVVGAAIGVFILPRAWRLGARGAAGARAGRARRARPRGDRTPTSPAIAGVVDVHDLHVWTLTSEMDVATAHLMVAPHADTHGVLDAGPPGARRPLRHQPRHAAGRARRPPGLRRRELVSDELDAVFRRESGRCTATLIRVLGDIDLAEDAVAEAFVIAAEKWPVTGIPPNPGGWITTTARNRAIDRLRREPTRTDRYVAAHRLHAPLTTSTPIEPRPPRPRRLVDVVADDQLRLMFLCCHPALAPDAQVALTLRLLGGLDTPEIARAFLVPEATMAQRIVRAKRKLRDNHAAYRIPLRRELPGPAPRGAHRDRSDLHRGAHGDVGRRVWCAPTCRARRSASGRVLVELMPDEPEAVGLLALMLLTDARRPARLAADGTMVRLADQDRIAAGTETSSPRVTTSCGPAFDATRRDRSRSRPRSPPSTPTHRPPTAPTGRRSWRCTTSSHAPATQRRRRAQPSARVARAATAPSAGLAALDRLADDQLARLPAVPRRARRPARSRGPARPKRWRRTTGRIELTTNPAERSFLHDRRAEVATGPG